MLSVNWFLSHFGLKMHSKPKCLCRTCWEWAGADRRKMRANGFCVASEVMNSRLMNENRFAQGFRHFLSHDVCRRLLLISSKDTTRELQVTRTSDGRRQRQLTLIAFDASPSTASSSASTSTSSSSGDVSNRQTERNANTQLNSIFSSFRYSTLNWIMIFTYFSMIWFLLQKLRAHVDCEGRKRLTNTFTMKTCRASDAFLFQNDDYEAMALQRATSHQTLKCFKLILMASVTSFSIVGKLS